EPSAVEVGVAGRRAGGSRARVDPVYLHIGLADRDRAAGGREAAAGEGQGVGPRRDGEVVAARAVGGAGVGGPAGRDGGDGDAAQALARIVADVAVEVVEGHAGDEEGASGPGEVLGDEGALVALELAQLEADADLAEAGGEDVGPVARRVHQVLVQQLDFVLRPGRRAQGGPGEGLARRPGPGELVAGGGRALGRRRGG